MKKVLSLVLVLLMLSSLLLACQKTADPTSNPEGSGVIAKGERGEEDPNGYVKDRLPTGEALEALGFAGSTVKVLGYEEDMNETFPKEDSENNEDPVQRRLYNHWRGIEEQFGITFEVEYIKNYYAHRNAFMTRMRADDALFDLLQTESLFPIGLATEGKLCNLKNLDYPDLEVFDDGTMMPWWPESVEQFTQYGGLYFIGSNSGAYGISNMCVIYVAAEKIQSDGMADPVQSVLRGMWTVQELTNIVKYYAPAAEAAADEESRYYGIVADHTSRLTSFLYSSGFSEIVNNADGVGELAYDEQSELEAISKALDRYAEMWTGAQAKIHREDPTRDIFDELKHSRTATFLGYIQMLRELENTDEYTVVPLPLLDDAQSDPESAGKGYRTIHRDCFDLWSIPVTTSNKVLSGMIIEANASGEYRNIAPFYYEQYLKDRYSNDANGRVCFDILRASVVYDLGRISQMANIGIKSVWSSCFTVDGVKNTFIADVDAKLASEKLNFQKMLDSLAEYVEQ